eukprot:1189534-Prorocentrum_minimum.AAC.8
MSSTPQFKEFTKSEARAFNKFIHGMVKNTKVDSSKLPKELVTFFRNVCKQTASPIEAVVFGFISFANTCAPGTVITVPQDKRHLAEPAITFVLILMLSGSTKSLLCNLLTKAIRRVQDEMTRDAQQETPDDEVPGYGSSELPASPQTSQQTEEDDEVREKKVSILYERMSLPHPSYTI